MNTNERGLIMARRTKADIMAGIEGVINSKIVDHNTIRYQLETEEGVTTVYRLHDTDILTYWPDGSVTLNTDGWTTPTTKDRMNKLLVGWRIRQDKKIWYLSNGGPTYVYADGMNIDKDDNVTGAGVLGDLKAKKKKVRKYVKGYCKQLFAREMEAPNGGDCWCCLFDMKGSDHFESHFDEKYYVPSILQKAAEELGASPATMHQIGYYWGIHEDNCGPFDGHARRSIPKLLIRYIDRQVGLAR